MAVEERGLTIVLSPAQLAAVLSHDTLSSDAAFTNRLWGAARTVGSIVELLGAGVLCALPEPTMASKAGCVVLGLHGADNFTAGTRQAWTGAETRSLTEQGASAAAQGLGAGKELGDDIGLAVDIAVPMAFASALGAARLAAVRAGRIRLAEHEAEIGSRIGGHTLAEHVGKTQAQLEARLALRDNRWMRVASSFKNRRLAEEAVSKAIRANEVAIKQWAATAKAGARQPFGAEIGKVIGHGVVKRTGKLVPMTRVRIVLKMETYKGLPYYILTAFPEL